MGSRERYNYGPALGSIFLLRYI